ncbi:A disintegrin and metalloproteinase with thrombospondin motifs 12 [Dissostichus eleginoides]|uniref:A disintegrin and metalloproteinase with thrombospondin motifs 12 n=1 Tax=Dissostichus eleginoides TaxID=100907 RepID=A0AAD9CEP4_DISEL|nr:A disintegrin and metalloproteinase with thrombospondin motifs 12 [Dissostichus eleginoides]
MFNGSMDFFLERNKNPGFALEANSLSEGSAEAPAPPTLSPVLIVEEPSGFTTVELCQHGGEVCLSTSEGFMEELSGDPNCEDMQRKDQRLPSACPPSWWSPRSSARWRAASCDGSENPEMEEDEEDLFLEQCIPPANIADWGDEEEEEETLVNLNQQQGLTLIDLQSDAFRDDTPTLPPEQRSGPQLISPQRTCGEETS